MNKIISLFFTIILSLAMANLSFAQHSPNPNTINFNLTPEHWQADLRYFAEELPKRHKNAFHTMTRKQFESAVKLLNADIPNLTNEQTFVGFLKLIAMVGDGHTSINEQNLTAAGVYPLRYETYSDGIYIQFAAAEYAEIVGGKVVKIGNVPIEDVLKRVWDLT